MTLSSSFRLRLVTFCLLYLVQGIPLGFITITLVASLADAGYSASGIAQFMMVVWVPWALKIGVAPLLDRFSTSPMGKRRPWILAAQIGMVGAFAMLLLVPGLDGFLVAISGLLLIYNTCGALQDVAADALAVDLLSDAERGRITGWMWGSRIFGIAVGGAGLSSVLNAFGWMPAIAVQLVVLVVTTGVVFAARETPGDTLLAPFPGFSSTGASGAWAAMKVTYRSLWDVFQHPIIATLSLLALLGSVPTRLMVVYGPVFAVQRLGWTDVGYSQFASGPALLAGGVGAVVGGWAVDRFGGRNTLCGALAGIICIFALFPMAEPWWDFVLVVVAFLIIGSFLDLAFRIALQSLQMGVTENQFAASQFAVFMALGNASNILGGLFVVVLEQVFGPALIFASAAAFCVGPLILALRLPRQALLYRWARMKSAVLSSPP